MYSIAKLMGMIRSRELMLRRARYVIFGDLQSMIVFGFETAMEKPSSSTRKGHNGKTYVCDVREKPLEASVGSAIPVEGVVELDTESYHTEVGRSATLLVGDHVTAIWIAPSRTAQPHEPSSSRSRCQSCVSPRIPPSSPLPPSNHVSCVPCSLSTHRHLSCN